MKNGNDNNSKFMSFGSSINEESNIDNEYSLNTNKGNDNIYHENMIQNEGKILKDKTNDIINGEMDDNKSKQVNNNDDEPGSTSNLSVDAPIFQPTNSSQLIYTKYSNVT